MGRKQGRLEHMPERLLLFARWIAIFALAASIALIFFRWKLPRKREPSVSALGYWREVWRQWRKSRKKDRERCTDARALRRKSVLVVDPDERSSRVLVWRLECLGCKVRRARTGALALETALSAKPDVIIADALLPDVSAVDLFNTVGLPVVFVGVLKAQRKEIAALGDSVACLGKPFDPDEAAAAAGRLLRRNRSGSVSKP